MTRDEKPIGVAVLGLGNVGSEVVRIIEESADDLAARIGAPLVLRGIGVRRVADDRGVPVELLTDDIEELVSRDDVDIVVELMGPVEPARKAILSRARAGQVGRHRQQGADGAVHRRTGAGRRARPRRPVLRGRGRRRHPGHPPADPVAGRRHRAAGGRHRQRHHQLHPLRDGQHRRRLRRCAGRRERARLRRGRPDRRRRGLRRRGQGRDPGVHRVPHPGDRRRRLPRGHHQGHARPTSRRRARWAAPSSCCPSASGSPPTKGSNGFRRGSIRRWCR